MNADDEDLIGVVETEEFRTKRKVEQVAELTLLGLTQQQIADRLGVGQPYVSRLLKQAKEEWKANRSQAYDELVQQEIEHYRILLAALERGISAGSWKHIETAIKLSERRAKVIGLDHSDRMEEARVRIEAAQLDLMSRAFTAALDAIGVNENQRRLATETLLGELEAGGTAA
jgi:transcriptional regulator with XRE-family HTH domain